MKVARHRASKEKPTVRFQPSRIDAALYRTLTSANRPMAVKELMNEMDAAHATVDHTMRFWLERGLVKRAFLDGRGWYSWAPKPEASEMVKALADSAALLEVVPTQQPKNFARREHPQATSDPVAQALRAIAAILEQAAARIETKGD